MLLGITIVLLLLLTLAASVLCLSAVGHLHNKVDALRPQITATELLAEVQFQARVCRRQFTEYMDERVLPTIGWKPEPTMEQQLESMMAQVQERTKAKMQA